MGLIEGDSVFTEAIKNLVEIKFVSIRNIFDVFNHVLWEFLFEKSGYCFKALDCVCGTTWVAGANYVAIAIPLQFTVGLGRGKGQYTLSTADFGGIYHTLWE